MMHEVKQLFFSIPSERERLIILMSVPIEELRSVVYFLLLESNENQDIYSRLCAVYGDNIITLGTVQKWTKKMNEHTFSIFKSKKTGIPRRSDLDQKIANFILSYPYASTKRIAKNVGAEPYIMNG